MYFGWNLGLPAGGTYGLLAATALVTVLYVCFVLAYAELACAVPRAGGAFVYAERAFGPTAGLRRRPRAVRRVRVRARRPSPPPSAPT